MQFDAIWCNLMQFDAICNSNHSAVYLGDAARLPETRSAWHTWCPDETDMEQKQKHETLQMKEIKQQGRQPDMECRHIVAWRSSCRSFEHCPVSPDNKHLQLYSSQGVSNMFNEHQETMFTNMTEMVVRERSSWDLHNLCVLPGALPTRSHRSQFATLWKICSDKVITTLGTRHGFARIRLTELQDTASRYK